MSNAAPGWYPVEGDDRRRYWDGQTWTEHYEEARPVAAFAPPVTSATLPAPQPPKSGLSTKSKAVLGGAAFVLFFGVVGAFAGDEEPEKAATSSGSSSSPKPTSKTSVAARTPTPTAISASSALAVLASAPQPKNVCAPTPAETQALMGGLASHEEPKFATIHVQTYLSAECDTAKKRAAEAKAAAAAAAAEAKARAALVNPKTYKAIDKRALAKVVRNPESYVGQKYVIFAQVTQFDSITGGDRFRADVAHKDIRSYGFWTGGENSMVDAGAADLSEVINGDIVKMHVVVSGVESYETTMGATLTVPVFEVNILKVIGSAD